MVPDYVVSYSHQSPGENFGLPMDMRNEAQVPCLEQNNTCLGKSKLTPK